MTATDDHAKESDYSMRIADLMVRSDEVLERFYKRSIICTVVVVAAVAGLLLDIAFLSLFTTVGKLVYYASLVLLLGALLAYLYSYYDYTHKGAAVNSMIADARKKLAEQEELEKLKEKIRARIDRMSGEAAWFSQLMAPGAIESLDRDTSEERGNEEFEYFVRKFFEKMGFRVEHSTVVLSSGIYMRMARDDRKYLIYPVHPPRTLDEEDVRETYRELLSEQEDAAVIVTSGSFTQKAKEFAARKQDLLLYDRSALLEGIKGIVGALRTRIEQERRVLNEADTVRVLAEALKNDDGPKAGASS